MWRVGNVEKLQLGNKKRPGRRIFFFFFLTACFGCAARNRDFPGGCGVFLADLVFFGGLLALLVVPVPSAPSP